jgi:hypothetical protein
MGLSEVLLLRIGDFEGAWDDEAFNPSDAPRPRSSILWYGSILLVHHQSFLHEDARDWDRVQRVVLNLRRARRE